MYQRKEHNTDLNCLCVISERIALFLGWALVVHPETHHRLHRKHRATQRQDQNVLVGHGREGMTKAKTTSLLSASLKFNLEVPVISQTNRR